MVSSIPSLLHSIFVYFNHPPLGSEHIVDVPFHEGALSPEGTLLWPRLSFEARLVSISSMCKQLYFYFSLGGITHHYRTLSFCARVAIWMS